MGNQQSSAHKTYIANAYSTAIYAKVTEDYNFVQNEKLEIGEVSESESFRYIYQHPGFVKIMPGEYLHFDMSGNDGKVYVTARTDSDKLVASNFPMKNDHSCIVDKDGCIQHTQYGCIWRDVQGKNHFTK